MPVMFYSVTISADGNELTVVRCDTLAEAEKLHTSKKHFIIPVELDEQLDLENYAVAHNCSVEKAVIARIDAMLGV